MAVRPILHLCICFAATFEIIQGHFINARLAKQHGGEGKPQEVPRDLGFKFDDPVKYDLHLAQRGNSNLKLRGETTQYNVQVDHYGKKGKCIQSITVKGGEIYDTFTSECPGKDLYVINTDNKLLVGDLTTTYTLYSTTPNILVIIKKEHCLKKRYETVNDKTKKHRLLVHYFTQKECREWKRKIREEILMENKRRLEQGSAKIEQNQEAPPPKQEPASSGFSYYYRPSNSFSPYVEPYYQGQYSVH